MHDQLYLLPWREPTEPEYRFTHNLPRQLSPLLGREQEEAAVCSLLRRSEVRLLTLTGPGGIGKTRLSLLVAAELLDDFRDGACFVSLAPISDAALVLPTIAQALGLKESSEQPVPDMLKAFLSDKDFLLLLDNFEQIVSAAPALTDLLVTCPGVKMLVTSRASLHVQGEHEFQVPPLTVPDLKHFPPLEALGQYSAVALFLWRVRAIQPAFELNKHNARAVAEICIRLDGVPLAIELAAARSKVLPPLALLARLSQPLAVLTSGAKDAPPRHQTLRNTIAWSYNLLDIAEQRLFRRLSVFVGGCTLEAVEFLCAALSDDGGVLPVLDGVASLIDKSLLQHMALEEGKARFGMLETIREFALECFAASTEEQAAHHAHAAYYLALAEQAEPELRGPQQTRWMETLAQEFDNLRAAMQWSLQPGETGQNLAMALRFGGTLGTHGGFWEVHGHWSEGWNFLEQTLSRTRGSNEPARAKALNAAANLATLRGDNDQAEVFCKESLTMFRELGDKRGMAYSLYLLGWVTWDRGQLALTRSLREDALVLWRAVDDQEGIFLGLLALGSLATHQAEYARARILLEESLTMSRKQSNRRNIAESLRGLAKVLFLSQGDCAAAQTLLEEALAHCLELGHREGIANTLHLLGQVALGQGDVASADVFLTESLALFQELGDWGGITPTLSLLGRAKAAQGDYRAAQAFYQKSLRIAKEGNYKLQTASFLEGLAMVVAAQKELVWAAHLWGTAEVLREGSGVPLPPVERVAYEQSVAVARSELGEKMFAAAWFQGRTMTPEQALDAHGAAATLPPLSTQPTVPPSVKRASAYPTGLTAREVEVLRLVAQGLTDAQVAEQLVISPRTVNWHLTSIYSKIGVSSRVAATRYAIAHHVV